MKWCVLPVVILASLAATSGHAQPDPLAPEPPPAPERAAEPAPGPIAEPAGAPAAHLGFEVFGGYAFRTYDARNAGDPTWDHRFDVERAHLWVAGEYHTASARVVLEAARGTGEGGLIGVARDSLVLRLREAWAGWTPFHALTIRAGLVSLPTVSTLESAWTLRVIAPIGVDLFDLVPPADLGGTARYALPADYGAITLGASSGEGYDSRDLNRGKTFEGAAEIHPLASIAALRPLAIYASYILGSEGAGLSRADRFTTALLWIDDRVGGGAAFTYAWGYDAEPARRAWLLDAFVHTEPVDRLLLGARVAHFARDTNDSADAETHLTLSAGVRLEDPLDVHLALTRRIAGDTTRSATPDAQHWEARAVARVRWE